MAGLNDILDIARSALSGQRAAMDVTSNNIANASTPGYSRQRAELAPAPSIVTSSGLLGTGVSVRTISRIRNQFLDQQVRSANQTLSDAQAQQAVLGQVEAAVNEPSDSGLSTALDNFFNAFQDLSTQPEESVSRSGVIQQATLLAQTFHRVNANIADVRNNLVDDITSTIDQVNSLADDISALEATIQASSANGGTPADLLDARDAKIDDLSKLVPVSVSEDSSGSVIVSVNGAVIASKAGAVHLTPQQRAGGITLTAGASGRGVAVATGDLGAKLTAYNATLPGYLSRLDEVASALITRINAVHSGGYGLGDPPSTGTGFFTGSTAGDIAVNPALVSNPSLVAASSDGTAGDNGTAAALAAVRDERLLGGNSETLQQYYGGLVSDIGTAISSASGAETSQTLIATQLENQRTSVSGVSLDEEMTNLIRYQRSYQAASRVVSTVDDMFNSLIAMV